MHTQHKTLVLVTDDDEHIRHALTTRLSQADFEVIEARNVQGAKVIFDAHTPAAAVLDVQLPDGDGFAICEHIRASGSGIPVFLLTGADAGIIRNNLPVLSSAVGADYFVRKPFDGKALVMLLRDALADPTRSHGNQLCS